MKEKLKKKELKRQLALANHTVKIQIDEISKLNKILSEILDLLNETENQNDKEK